MQGEFCYILNSRQMGKSSLKVRVAARLRSEGIAVAQLDLTAVGKNLTPEQWYDGLLFGLGVELDLGEELDDFWRSHREVAPLLRWMRALREVVLARCRGQVVIFVDEIDTARSLPFSTDEFFAALRECYTRRAVDPEQSRLVFCLLGVATPADLIRDARTTPFNVGRRIELQDFTAAEAAPWHAASGVRKPRRTGCSSGCCTGRGAPLPDPEPLRCARRRPERQRPPRRRSTLRGPLLLGPAREIDKNLGAIGSYLLREDVARAEVLDLYDRMRRGRGVRTGGKPLIETVRLSGIARAEGGSLRVRNRIYKRVFDREWIRASMPDAEQRRQRKAYRKGFASATALSLLVIALIIWSGIQAYRNLKWAEANEDAAEGILNMTNLSIKQFVNDRNFFYKNKISDNPTINNAMALFFNRRGGKLVRFGLDLSVENYGKLPIGNRETTLYNRVLSAMLDDIGDIEFNSGDYAKAEESYRSAIAHQHKACSLADKHIAVIYKAIWPDNNMILTYKNELDIYYLHLISSQIKMGRDPEARSSLLDRQGRCLGRPREIVHFARVLAQRPSPEDRGNGLGPEERRKLDDMVVDALRFAIAKGYKWDDDPGEAGDFEPLRSREDFRSLIGR